MLLLHGHILQRLGAATAVVYHAIVATCAAPNSLRKRLRAVGPKYPPPRDRDEGKGPVFLPFDEAQATYGDGILWNDCFKDVSDVTQSIVSSYFAVMAVTLRVLSLKLWARPSACVLTLVFLCHARMSRVLLAYYWSALNSTKSYRGLNNQ